MLYALVAVIPFAGNPRWAVIQSDSRSDHMMVRQSAGSYIEFASKLNATYLHYNCNARLLKPLIVAGECHKYDLLLWADTDSVAHPNQARDFQRHVLAHMRRNQQLQLLFGTDFYSTNERVRAGKTKYVGNFNAGVFVAVCPAANMLLNEWAYHTLNSERQDDQVAIQEMAAANSVWHNNIYYDFRIAGVHSAFFDHFPGSHKHKFPKSHEAIPGDFTPSRCRWKESRKAHV